MFLSMPAPCQMLRYPQVDYNKLAELSGMTNPKSAANAWAAIKKKLAARGSLVKDDGGDTGTASPAKTPKSKPRAKRGKKADDEDDDAEESPTKKVKPTPKGKKGKAAKSEPEIEEDASDGDKGVVKEEDAADGE